MSFASGTFKKTRIAPTPSGYLHIGNAYSFALTAALARKTGASILLRIDDLDQDRANSEYIQDIFDTLNFLDIPWDEGPGNAEEFKKTYSQLHRLKHYESALQRLASQDKVFACNCSRQQIIRANASGNYPDTCTHKKIPLDEKNVCWRLKTDENIDLILKDLNGAAKKYHLPETMRSFIVRRKDGLPAYQLTSVIDDLHFGVDLIVRGMDLYDSTLAQLYLAAQLKENTFLNTTFYHHNLFLGKDKRKISKSAGDTSIAYLRKEKKCSKEDIYKEIAKKVGLTREIKSWQDLIDFV